ncbi:glycoside hydrolase family 47 protein [Desarmillaria tabescens]|uniref:alpha-1,2-Mannosidase n=1 Tax=Armillaria tabescens TaxID=1929756 RepID=A0AA39KC99_ARMTA|nr:glycoside hydrolase family 47 protein [Desarmillaria tabescens]KAK0457211.1 glycoside hydrolase family 47 protein [Desarmillaria tabescens]
MNWRIAALVLLHSTTWNVPVLAVQKDGLTIPSSAAASRDAVRDIFVKSYDAYKQYAWGHDDLMPESKSFYDGRNGWGSSIVDALGTMRYGGTTYYCLVLILLQDLLDEAIEYIGTVDFSVSKTSSHVSVFETTIRYLGGLLSVYELRGNKDNILLQKAQEIADKLAFAWVGDNDLPFGWIDFSNDKPDIATSNIAEAGTLIMEWATLSKHTGNSTYQELAEKAFRHIATLVGLAAQSINPSTGNFVGGYVAWGGGSDSYFEYLLKYPVLVGLDDPLYIDTWRTAVDSSIKYLLRYRYISSHLTCFHAGNWLYGGTLLGNDTIVAMALGLMEGCWNSYAGTATGIGPESFAYMASDGNYTGATTPSADQLTFYEEHGYYITSSYYILRPEVLESNFYAAVNSFKKFLPGAVVFDGIYDVNNVTSAKVDDMESFWFAEVLKYLYLTFDDPENINIDDYIFNTEAHPLKASEPLAQYGSGALVPNKPFKTESGPPAAVSPTSYDHSKTHSPKLPRR